MPDAQPTPSPDATPDPAPDDRAFGAASVRLKRKKATKKRAKTRPRRRTPDVAVDAAPAKRGRGRPRKEPTKEHIETVRRLASLGLTVDDIAYSIDFPRSTFYDYMPLFSDALKAGKANLAVRSSAQLLKQMMAGNMTAHIWLDKTRLGLTERVHTLVSSPEGGPVEQHVQHSGAVAIGLFLPPNGRDVPAPGQVFPPALTLPPNGRDA